MQPDEPANGYMLDEAEDVHIQDNHGARKKRAMQQL